MSVVRVNKNKDYTNMSNIHLRDKTLSLKAKGLLSVVLSLPEGWKYSVSGLVSICKESETSVKSALDELKEHKYLTVTKIAPNKENNGRYEYIYDFYEKPQIQEGEKQEVENLPLENQPLEILGVENHPLYKDTDKSITDISNTDKSITDKSERKKVSTRQTFDQILDSVDYIREDSELRDTFVEFIKMRKLIKKPLTDFALKKIINEACNLANGDPELIKAIVEQSIVHSWQGVFPLKDNSSKLKQASSNSDNVEDGAFWNSLDNPNL